MMFDDNNEYDDDQNECDDCKHGKNHIHDQYVFMI